MENKPRISDLVAKSLHHKQPVVRDRPGDVPLAPEVLQNVPCRIVVHRELPLKPGETVTAVDHPRQFPPERPHLFPRARRFARSLPLPERHARRLPGGGRNDHPVPVDLGNAPDAAPEDKRVSRPALVHELFVHFPHASLPVLEIDPEMPPVGDRSAAGDCQVRGPGSARRTLFTLSHEMRARAPGAPPRCIAPPASRAPHRTARGRATGNSNERRTSVVECDRFPNPRRHHGHDLLRQDVETILGIYVRSTAWSIIARATTADSTRSSRWVGMIRPLLDA